MIRFETPLGTARAAASEAGLTHLFLEGAVPPPPAACGEPASDDAVAHLEAAVGALHEYFAGERRHFDDLTLAPDGTPFQQRVWRALRTIPFGTTESYGAIARRIDAPGAARAVGLANHCNPLWIMIPCHRVIGADGSLTGYAGGLERKRWLLAHEANLALPLLAMAQATGNHAV